MRSSNKKIALNTLALYFRMIVIMIVSLYSSRVVLDALGVSDYGLYAVVGGVVALFTFISNSMASTTQRFLNFEKGKNTAGTLSVLFGTSRYVHILIACGMFLLIESIGLWILNRTLNISPERMFAANWVFHLSTLALLFTIINVPYRAVIIANEKMEVFALLGIIEVVLKLGIAWAITFTPGDKLIWYGALILVSTFLVNFSYVMYAKKEFAECRGPLVRDKRYLGNMFSFSSWSLLSGVSIVLRNQGINILLNLFYGTIMNAAYGIANQVSVIVTGFVSNFTQAVNPQIVKDYASNRIDLMHNTVIFSSKASFLLLFLFAFPLFIEADYILTLWLHEVPQFTVIFTRLVLLQVLVESFAAVHGTAQGATGKVRLYHIVLSTVGMMNLPISYFTLLAGAQPYIVFVVSIVISSIISILRLLFLRRSIHLPLKRYFSSVVVPCFGVLAVTIPVTVLLKTQLPDTDTSVLVTICVCVLLILIATFYLGMKTTERDTVILKIKSKLKM